MKNTFIQIFLIKFKNEISFHEIPLFRGAIINLLGQEGEVLYHNHANETSFRYSYPLIQYKRIHKKAAIFCIGEGVEVIGQLLEAQNCSLMLGERQLQLEIDAVCPKRNLLQTWDSTFRYRIHNWLPFNSDNYQRYKDLDDICSKTFFLEQILIGNLLSFAKGLNIYIEKEIICKLLTLKDFRLIKAKGVKMMAFDAEFKANISLPDYIGIGKHASLGFGTVVRIYNENNVKR